MKEIKPKLEKRIQKKIEKYYKELEESKKKEMMKELIKVYNELMYKPDTMFFKLRGLKFASRNGETRELFKGIKNDKKFLDFFGIRSKEELEKILRDMD